MKQSNGKLLAAIDPQGSVELIYDRKLTNTMSRETGTRGQPLSGRIMPSSPGSSIEKEVPMHPRSLNKSNEWEADISEPQYSAKLIHEQKFGHAELNETDSSILQMAGRERTSSESVIGSISFDPDPENVFKVISETDQSYGEAERSVPSQRYYSDRPLCNAITHHLVLPSKRHLRQPMAFSHRNLASPIIASNTNTDLEQPELKMQRSQSLRVSKCIMSHCQVMKLSISLLIRCCVHHPQNYVLAILCCWTIFIRPLNENGERPEPWAEHQDWGQHSKEFSTNRDQKLMQLRLSNYLLISNTGFLLQKMVIQHSTTEWELLYL